MLFIPHSPKTKNKHIPYRSYQACKVLHKIIWGAKKKQAWQLKKCLYKLLPLFRSEKEWAKSCCFKANYKSKSWSCKFNGNFLNCFQLFSCIFNIMSLLKNSSFLSIYLYYIVSPMNMSSHQKYVTPTYSIQPFFNLGIYWPHQNIYELNISEVPKFLQCMKRNKYK